MRIFFVTVIAVSLAVTPLAVQGAQSSTAPAQRLPDAYGTFKVSQGIKCEWARFDGIQRYYKVTYGDNFKGRIERTPQSAPLDPFVWAVVQPDSHSHILDDERTLGDAMRRLCVTLVSLAR